MSSKNIPLILFWDTAYLGSGRHFLYSCTYQQQWETGREERCRSAWSWEGKAVRGSLEGIEGRFDQNTVNACMKLYACIHFKTLKSIFLSVLLHHTVLSDMRYPFSWLWVSNPSPGICRERAPVRGCTLAFHNITIVPVTSL